MAALGAGVLVSLALSTTFNRDDLDAKIRGRDRVGLLAKARGASGEAWLDVDATNIHAHAHGGEKYPLHEPPAFHSASGPRTVAPMRSPFLLAR